MKITKRMLSGLLAVAIIGSFGLNAVGCTDPERGREEVPTATISIDDVQSVLYYGSTVTLKVTVSGTENTAYTWQVDNPSVLEVSDENVVSVKTKVTVDTVVTVTAVLKSNTAVTDSVAFTVKPLISGSNGDLTSEAFENINTDNITFEGTMTDHYTNLENHDADAENTYDMVVKMNKDVWYGAWWRHTEDGTAKNIIEDNYRKAAEADRTGKHPIETQYITLQNTVATKPVKTSMSEQVYWENMHYWNHLAGLGTDIASKFQYSPDTDDYLYLHDTTTDLDNDGYADDDMLLTILAYSLTPMLNETFDEVWLKVEDGAITHIYAKTYVVPESEDTDYTESGVPLQSSYSEIDIDIKDVGSTVVPDVKPYDAPENAEVLQTAIQNMQNATGYAFQAVDTQTSAPSYDEGDYSTESLAYTASTVANIVPLAAYTIPAATPKGPFQNSRPSSGSGYVVGTTGWINHDTILLRSVSEYANGGGMSIRYDGYRQYDGYFEKFTSSPVQTYENFPYLTAESRIVGNMYENIAPQWNFSANLFEMTYVGRLMDATGSYYQGFTFTLRNSSITRDVAKQLTIDGNQTSASSSVRSSLEICVDTNGNVKRVSYPYDISGVYIGYVDIDFYNVNNVSFREEDFTADYYKQRDTMERWDQYTSPHYYPPHNKDDSSHYNDGIPADQAIKAAFGADALDHLFTPADLMQVFGDEISGPWYDWDEIEPSEEGGDVTYREIISLNTEITTLAYPDYIDENGHILEVEHFIGRNGLLTNVMKEAGFEYVNSESGYYNATSDMSYATYTNDTFAVVVENIGSRYFYFDIYDIHNYRKASVGFPFTK